MPSSLLNCKDDFRFKAYLERPVKGYLGASKLSLIMNNYLMYLLLSAMCISCTDQKSNEVSKSILQPTFDAHGGLDNWKSFKGLAFSLINDRGETQDTQQIITDLEKRFERITSTESIIGYDGKEYWKTILDTSANRTNPEFVINLQFYFFAMPFVLADPGVYLESLGKKKIGQESYDVVKATFGDSIGVAPKDQYLLYLDENTQRLEALLYSVTYFNPDNAEKYGALVYTDWQEIDGMLLPKTVIRRNWLEGKQEMAGSRGTKTFEQVVLAKTGPSVANFKKP